MLAKYFSVYYIRILENEILRAVGLVVFFILFFILRYEGLFLTIVEKILNDIVLRYLGLFIIVMFLYELAKLINVKGRVAIFVGIVAENSFGIYLLQYFFLPDFRGYEWVLTIDPFTLFIICVIFTLICTTVCLVVISILSKSAILCRYVLGKR